MSRFLDRFPSTNVPIFGLGAFLYGFLLLVGSDAPFRAPVYHYAFAVVPRPIWAIAFMAAGASAIAWVSLTTALALTFVLTLWAMNWFAASVGHPHEVPAFSPVLICSVAAALAISVARRGATRDHDIHPHLEAALTYARLQAETYDRLDSTARDVERTHDVLQEQRVEQQP